MRLTVWHKGTDKPVRDGVYERQYSSGTAIYCLFKQGHWKCGYTDIEYAAQEKYSSLNQNLPWRGITKDKK